MIEALALATAAAFAGAAIYVNVAEQPARLLLDDAALLAEWGESYKRAAVMQGSLAVVAGVLGLLAWQRSGDSRWLVGGVAMLANWPYTLMVIMPTNNRLKATHPALAGPESRALIRRWGRLHAGRSLLGTGAVILYLVAAEVI